MNQFLAYTVVGIVAGCIYAITATGLVVTYTTTGIFNFAHGAVGMVSAFAYWQLSSADAIGPLSFHLSQPVAALVVIFVMAPLFGAAVEWVLMRPLRGASLDVTLTVTLGLLLLLLGLAVVLWDPTKPRIIYPFFRGASVTICMTSSTRPVSSSKFSRTCGWRSNSVRNAASARVRQE